MRALFLALALATTASAANFSFTGNFLQDDDVAWFGFSLAAPGSVTIQTLGYAGGTNANSDVIPDGGFDPIVSLFSVNGMLIDENDDGSFPDVGIDPVSGLDWDSFLVANLGAGFYYVALTQFDNFAVGPNLLNGFTQTGASFTASFGCGNGQFCDDNGFNRTSAWALDILNADSASQLRGQPQPVPEPGTVALLGAGLALALIRRRRRS
jgi:hypothetical protein